MEGGEEVAVDLAVLLLVHYSLIAELSAERSLIQQACHFKPLLFLLLLACDICGP